MPIHFLLSKRVLLSVGREPTSQAYAEKGALFYNALTHESAFDFVRGIVPFLGGFSINFAPLCSA